MCCGIKVGFFSSLLVVGCAQQVVSDQSPCRKDSLLRGLKRVYMYTIYLNSVSYSGPKQRSPGSRETKDNTVSEESRGNIHIPPAGQPWEGRLSLGGKTVVHLTLHTLCQVYCHWVDHWCSSGLSMHQFTIGPVWFDRCLSGFLSCDYRMHCNCFSLCFNTSEFRTQDCEETYHLTVFGSVFYFLLASSSLNEGTM